MLTDKLIKCRAKLDRLAEFLGTRLEDRDIYTNYSFDGFSIATRIQGNFLYPRHVLHELAHFMVASPEQRKHPNFGFKVPFEAWTIPGADLQPFNGFIETHEGNIQEYVTSLVEAELGPVLKISPKDRLGDHLHHWNHFKTRLRPHFSTHLSDEDFAESERRLEVLRPLIVESQHLSAK